MILILQSKFVLYLFIFGVYKGLDSVAYIVKNKIIQAMEKRYLHAKILELKRQILE